MKKFNIRDIILKKPDNHNISSYAEIFNIDDKNYYYYYIGHYNNKSKKFSKYGDADRNETNSVTYVEPFEIVHKKFNFKT